MIGVRNIGAVPSANYVAPSTRSRLGLLKPGLRWGINPLREAQHYPYTGC